MSDPVVRTRVDAGRVLLWVYALFVVAAGARSVVQLGTHASRAPLAYSLSGVAAVVYACGFLLLRSAGAGGPTRPAAVLAVIELLGVVLVGSLSLAAPGLLAEPTVWSDFGAGYLCVPLVLPMAALFRLRAVAITP